MAGDIENLQADLERFNEALTDIARQIAIQGGQLIGRAATEEHMVDAGAGGPPFPPRSGSGGPLRILSGRLAASVRGTPEGPAGGMQGLQGNLSPRSVGAIRPGGLGTRNFPAPGTGSTRFGDESINEVKIGGSGVTLIKGSRVPYAAVHEHGWSGTQNVRQHTRTGPFGTHTVPVHTRQVSIPARPYLRPAVESERRRIVDMAEEQLGDAAEVLLSA